MPHLSSAHKITILAVIVLIGNRIDKLNRYLGMMIVIEFNMLRYKFNFKRNVHDLSI